MNSITYVIGLLVRLPLGTGPHRKALRRRHLETILRAFGLSRNKASRWARHCP